MMNRGATPQVSGDPRPGRSRDAWRRRVSLVVLTAVVGALTACQGSPSASGSPFGFGGSSPAEYCQVLRQSQEHGEARNRVFKDSDALNRPGRNQTLDEADADFKRVSEAAPPEIRHDYEIIGIAFGKIVQALRSQPAGASADTSNLLVITAFSEMLKPEFWVATQHINNYNRTHCGIDTGGQR